MNKQQISGKRIKWSQQDEVLRCNNESLEDSIYRKVRNQVDPLPKLP